MDNTVIQVQNLSKSFRIPIESSNGLKQKLINWVKGRKGYREFSPLNDVSFIVEKGDFFGIVGRNGSGKSTLLKTIAGIYTPNQGAVQVNGTLVPFIELGVGFNPELTGRENIFLNGALLGFSRTEMEAMYDEIVNFAELHDFMDERLKNYSSGMQVRLAFSIAIKAEGDILLLDEVLAVGDEAFQKKCFAYFDNLKKNNKTVILITHDMNAVERFCDKAMLLDGGKVVAIGESSMIAGMYSKIFSTENEKKNKDAGILNKAFEKVNFEAIQSGVKTSVLNASQEFAISVTIQSLKAYEKAAIGLNIVNSSGQVMLAFGMGGANEEPMSIRKGENRFTFVFPQNPLGNSQYTLDAVIEVYTNPEIASQAFRNNGLRGFEVIGVEHRQHALAHVSYQASSN